MQLIAMLEKRNGMEFSKISFPLGDNFIPKT